MISDTPNSSEDLRNAGSRGETKVQDHERDNGAEDFGRLLLILWRAKWWIAAFTLAATAIAVFYVSVANRWYRAEAVVIARDNSGSGLSAQLAQFGGLADLVGLNLGQGSKQEPMGILQSRGFAARFIEKNNLLPVLGAKPPSVIARLISRDEELPTEQAVLDEFVRSILSVTEDKKTGLVAVSVEWRDPGLAAAWANDVVKQVNEEMRQRALVDAGRNLRYLREQLSSTSAVSLQQSISRLIESEMQKQMIARGTNEYAFRIIDDARPPARPVRPKKLVLVSLAFMASFFASCAAALAIAPLTRGSLLQSRAGF